MLVNQGQVLRLANHMNFSLYINGSRAVCRISLSFQWSQMNRFRLIDEVSIYFLGSNNRHITLLYFRLLKAITVQRLIIWDNQTQITMGTDQEPSIYTINSEMFRKYLFLALRAVRANKHSFSKKKDFKDLIQPMKVKQTYMQNKNAN